MICESVAVTQFLHVYASNDHERLKLNHKSESVLCVSCLSQLGLEQPEREAETQNFRAKEFKAHVHGPGCPPKGCRALTPKDCFLP